MIVIGRNLYSQQSSTSCSHCHMCMGHCSSWHHLSPALPVSHVFAWSSSVLHTVGHTVQSPLIWSPPPSISWQCQFHYSSPMYPCSLPFRWPNHFHLPLVACPISVVTITWVKNLVSLGLNCQSSLTSCCKDWSYEAVISFGAWPRSPTPRIKELTWVTSPAPFVGESDFISKAGAGHHCTYVSWTSTVAICIILHCYLLQVPLTPQPII